MPRLMINPADWSKFKLGRSAIGGHLIRAIDAPGPSRRTADWIADLKRLDMPVGFEESIKRGEFRLDRMPAEPEEEELTGGICLGCEIDHDPAALPRKHPKTRRAMLVCTVLRGRGG